jgi:DNA-binding transcriptional MerR regulator
MATEARDYLSIGEVLVGLKPEFPDVTISKIRFLESEGLIEPERTSSGYRKFYERDVDRLRKILKLQRDEYLPLRVIRERLQGAEDGDAPATEARPRRERAEEEVAVPTDVQVTAEELARSTGVEAAIVEELTSYGLLRPRRVNEERFYSGDDLVVLRILKEFFKFGVEPRHLTMYRHFADREAGFFEAIVLPMIRQRNPEAQRAAAEALDELIRASRKLKQTLVRANLSKYIG